MHTGTNTHTSPLPWLVKEMHTLAKGCSGYFCLHSSFGADPRGKDHMNIQLYCFSLPFPPSNSSCITPSLSCKCRASYSLFFKCCSYMSIYMYYISWGNHLKMQRVIDWLDLEYCGEIRILHVQSMMILLWALSWLLEPIFLARFCFWINILWKIHKNHSVFNSVKLAGH